MSSLSTLFSPVRKAVRAFFKQDLKLQRGGTGVRLVLEDRMAVPAPRPLSRAGLQAQKEKQELSGAREALARVLDEQPRGRSTLRHLAFVEHALEKKGWRGLYKIPLPVLQKGLEQLEQQVCNWSDAGLACLRSKMAVAVIDREHQDVDKEADAYRTAAVLDNPPEMAEKVIDAARGNGEEEVADDEAALLAAYATLGTAAPQPGGAVQMQGELGSPSAKALPRERTAPPSAEPIKLRDLQQG